MVLGNSAHCCIYPEHLVVFVHPSPVFLSGFTPCSTNWIEVSDTYTPSLYLSYYICITRDGERLSGNKKTHSVLKIFPESSTTWIKENPVWCTKQRFVIYLAGSTNLSTEMASQWVGFYHLHLRLANVIKFIFVL